MINTAAVAYDFQRAIRKQWMDSLYEAEEGCTCLDCCFLRQRVKRANRRFAP